MSKQISIQVYSDIHLESSKEFPKILPTAKYLFLAGDICKLNHNFFFTFFDYCSPLWEKIFYTPGNHEFYSTRKNYETLDFEYNLKLKDKYKNVYYLNNNFVALNDEINVYGCVFWNEYYNHPSLSYLDDDYANIQQFSISKGYNVKINNVFINNLAKKELEYIKNYFKMKQNKNKPTIIMTHFPPVKIGKLIDLKYINHFNFENIPLWISGHTHKSHDFNYENTRLLSNQVGYIKEFGKTGLYQEGKFTLNYNIYDDCYDNIEE
jgi:hypothetical protein